MLTKSMLSEIIQTRQSVEAMRQRTEQMLSVLDGCGISLDAVHTNSAHFNATDQMLSAYVDAKAELDALEQHLNEAKFSLADEIASITRKNYRDLIVKRYIESKTWRTIAEELNYSGKYVYRLHQQMMDSIPE